MAQTLRGSTGTGRTYDTNVWAFLEHGHLGCPKAMNTTNSPHGTNFTQEIYWGRKTALSLLLKEEKQQSVGLEGFCTFFFFLRSMRRKYLKLETLFGR